MAINAHTFKLNLNDQQESCENPDGNAQDLLGNMQMESSATNDDITPNGSIINDSDEDYSLTQNEMEEILLQGDLKVIPTQETCANNDNMSTKFNVLFVDFTKRMN
tara:strand:+ start:108 stop:425 length:318 start_codon:yes stop_codon:yes gene_type:complete